MLVSWGASTHTTILFWSRNRRRTPIWRIAHKAGWGGRPAAGTQYGGAKQDQRKRASTDPPAHTHIRTHVHTHGHTHVHTHVHILRSGTGCTGAAIVTDDAAKLAEIVVPRGAVAAISSEPQVP